MAINIARVKTHPLTDREGITRCPALCSAVQLSVGHVYMRRVQCAADVSEGRIYAAHTQHARLIAVRTHAEVKANFARLKALPRVRCASPRTPKCK